MKKIFISGGSKGIGLGIAKKFHSEGWKVGICARDESGLKAAAEMMPGLITYQCDLGIKEEVKAMAVKIRTDFEALDVLMNNGGMFLPGLLLEEDDELFERTMAVNMFSIYYLTKALLPDMVAKGSGTVINMSSVAGLQAYPNGISYGTSKFAVNGFSKALREEMKEKGVKVITLHPGATWTPSWEGVGIEPERMIPVEDVAELLWASCGLTARTVVEDIIIRPQLGDV